MKNKDKKVWFVRHNMVILRPKTPPHGPNQSCDLSLCSSEADREAQLDMSD